MWVGFWVVHSTTTTPADTPFLPVHAQQPQVFLGLLLSVFAQQVEDLLWQNDVGQVGQRGNGGAGRLDDLVVSQAGIGIETVLVVPVPADQPVVARPAGQDVIPAGGNQFIDAAKARNFRAAG